MAKRGGGGAKPHEETPHGKQFPTPLTSVRFAPPYSISLSKSLSNAQNFPQLTSSETAFGGSRKMVSDGPSSRGFAFRYVSPPPFSSAQVFPYLKVPSVVLCVSSFFGITSFFCGNSKGNSNFLLLRRGRELPSSQKHEEDKEEEKDQEDRAQPPPPKKKQETTPKTRRKPPR